MNITIENLFFICLCLFAVFKFILLPFTEKIVKNDRSITGFKKLLFRNIVGFFSLFFLLCTISSGFAWAILVYINSQGGATLTEAQASLASVKQVESWVSTFSDKLGKITAVFLILALVILSYKSTKQNFNKRAEKAFDKDLERLKLAYANDEWEELPMTEEMEKVASFIIEVDEEIEVKQTAGEDIQELSKTREELASILQHIDIKRRINIELDEEEYPKATSFFDKIMLFFVSKGLFNSLQKTGLIVFLLGAFLLIPALLSVSLATTHIDSIAENKLQTLEEKTEVLTLQIETSNIDEEFQRLVNVNVGNGIEDGASFSSEDEQALNHLSSAFESTIIANRMRLSLKPAVSRQIHKHNVKTALLKTFAKKGSATLNTDKLSGLVAEATHLDSRDIGSKKPVTALGKRIKTDLQQVANHNKKLWKKYKQMTIDATKSFQQPMSARNIKGMMVSNAMGTIIQGGAGSGDTGKLIQNLSQLPSDTAEQFYKTESKRFMNELAKADTVTDAVKQMDHNKTTLPKKYITAIQSSLSKFPDNADLKSTLDQHRASLSRLPEAHVRQQRAQQTIAKLASTNGRLRSRNFADALSGFGDYFPGYQGQEKTTAKGKALAKYSKVSADRLFTPSHSYTRARSYTRLRGFSRIGGVLIGKMPDDEQGSQLNVIDFNWQKKNKLFSLSLTTKDNQTVSLGEFNPAILNLALGYVADGRPTTVTMVASDPLYDLRILLHPVLVDTGLGCQAIRLDQIADETTSEDIVTAIMRGKNNNDIKNAEIIYRQAWALRAVAILEDEYTYRQALDATSIEYIVAIKEIAQNSDELAEILESRNSYNLAFLKKKSDFFDKKLVSYIENCISQSSFEACIKEKGRQESVGDFSWLIQPPETTEWSGVRERKYALDTDFKFLKLDEHDSLWPFRFMVQRVFTSEPNFVYNSDGYYDHEPWEFVDVNENLMKVIAQRISKENELKHLINNMREFAIAQRLFRLAFEDKLGESFPVDKLVQLANESHPYLSGYHRTLRWLPKKGAIEKELEVTADKKSNAQEIFQLKKQLREELGIYKDEQQILEMVNEACPAP